METPQCLWATSPGNLFQCVVILFFSLYLLGIPIFQLVSPLCPSQKCLALSSDQVAIRLSLRLPSFKLAQLSAFYVRCSRKIHIHGPAGGVLARRAQAADSHLLCSLVAHLLFTVQHTFFCKCDILSTF